ncbi:hypothetical protein [Sorangium sp. So ce861]|uniref:hypothetical protein n=1 Tax=Sorangium sp. So ce861 TaxID=3133323 RepID=UPI003F642C42
MKALTLTLTLACLFTVACGRTEDDICDDMCDCEGCNEREFNDCLDRYDVRFDEADRRDCLDRYDDLLACEDDTGLCRDYRWDTACRNEREALDRCVD